MCANGSTHAPLQVHAGFLDVLDSFLEATSGAMGMGDVVREISGKLWCLRYTFSAKHGMIKTY